MAADTSIEWTDRTWNPTVGCSVLSPGCTNCYAMKMAHRIELMGSAPHYAGTTKATKAGAVWTGKMALAPDAILMAPLRWKKARRIFVNSMSDLFHEDVPDEWIDRVFAVMSVCPQHTFQVLTKRAERMRDYMLTPLRKRTIGAAVGDLSMLLAREGRPMITLAHFDKCYTPNDGPFPNVWLGVSVEDRARKSRIDDLRATPAAVRFISFEPLLEDLGALDMTGVNLAIVGGESGPRSRDFEIEAAQNIQIQCRQQGTAFFMKQLGAVPTLARRVLKLKDRKGGDMAEWPEDMRVREMPT